MPYRPAGLGPSRINVDVDVYHHPQQPGVLLLYMGSQAPEGQGHPREGQPTWSTHGFQQNQARQLGEPHATYEGAEVAAPRNQALPPTHVPHVQDLTWSHRRATHSTRQTTT